MTLLVTSIAPDSLEELNRRAEQAWAGGTEAVEVRIDTFSGEAAELAAYLRAHNDHAWIVTCRSADEGGRFRGDLMERVSLLMEAARGTDAYVDFELADWRRSSNIRQKLGLASAKSDASGHRLILSAHDFSGVLPNLAELAHEMRDASGVAGGKIAYRPGRICDSFDALDLMRKHAATLSAIAMGEDGLWTRVLAKKLGGFATYCSLEAASATAPGQITLDEMVHRYRWSEIDSSTQVFGVIGHPIAHSMSPLLFNRWFADAGINAIYLPLHLTGEGDCLPRFLDGCRDRPWLDIGGFSVTIPHKMAALNWLGDRADHMAREIGALNTLSFCTGETEGFNTDCYAGVSSVAASLGVTRCDLVDVSVDVLGTGGAARALLYGLSMCGSRVTVYGRSRDKTHRVGDRFGARPAAWEDRTHRTGEVLVNCTNVGMWPDFDVSPVPPDSLEGCRLVFDLIYNPLETRLLKDAAAAGAKTLSGLDMFVRQAAMQFMLWTSTSPNTRYAPDLITREIELRTGTQS